MRLGCLARVVVRANVRPNSKSVTRVRNARVAHSKSKQYLVDATLTTART